LRSIIKEGRRKEIKDVEYANVPITLELPDQEEDTDLEVFQPLQAADSTNSPLRKRAKLTDKTQRYFASRVYNASRHKKPKSTKGRNGKIVVKQLLDDWKTQDGYVYSKNYIIAAHDIAYYANNAIALPTQLSLDARVILEAEPNERSKNSTAIFCVVLRDKYGFLKKFVFHNGKEAMSGPVRAKAHELGYDIIQAEQSHAEGQFLQFLYKRNAERHGHYTHIVGMGCSKKHCGECDSLLALFLGPNYHDITASVSHSKAKADTNPKHTATYHKLNKEAGITINLSYIREVDFCIVTQKEAVDAPTERYSRYYLPEPIKEAIKVLTGNDDLDLSAARFSNSENKKIEEGQKLEQLHEAITGLITKKIKKYNKGVELENLTSQVIEQLKKKQLIDEISSEETGLREYCKAQFKLQKAAQDEILSLSEAAMQDTIEY
jgi:hypothetical protein